jgi:hypothetical protein
MSILNIFYDYEALFLFTTASRTTLGPTQPPIQWIPGALSLGVMRPGREADHSPSSYAELKECVELCIHSTISFHGVVSSLRKKHGDNFTFAFRPGLCGEALGSTPCAVVLSTLLSVHKILRGLFN